MVALQIVANQLNGAQIKAEEESMTAYKTFTIDIDASIGVNRHEIVNMLIPDAIGKNIEQQMLGILPLLGRPHPEGEGPEDGDGTARLEEKAPIHGT